MENGCFLLRQVERCFGKHNLCLLSGVYLRFLIHLTMEKLKEKCRSLFRSRGCLECCTKPLLIALDKPSRSLKVEGERVAEDIWSSSTYEMESAAPSQRSVSSITNQTLDRHSNTSSEFVNQGLLRWNLARQQWIGEKGSHHNEKARQPTLSSWNATYESLLGTNKPFPRPIPLSEMVDFLVDVWEQEGLYD